MNLILFQFFFLMWPDKFKFEIDYIFRVSSYITSADGQGVRHHILVFPMSPLNSLVRSCYMYVVVQQEKIPKVMFGMNISSLEGVLYKGMYYVCIYKMGPITRIYKILSSCFYNKMNQFVNYVKKGCLYYMLCITSLVVFSWEILI